MSESRAIPFLGRADVSEASACHETGMVWPVVNRDRCFGDTDCVAACPYGVLAFGIVPEQASGAAGVRSPTPPAVRRQAYVVASERCAACGSCVAACAQRAIILRGRYEGQAQSRLPGLKI
jgi:NAD-dependent dihydropyrimidine dehydrogenase PreA subunit